MTFASADGVLLSASKDNTLRVWDLLSCTERYVREVEGIQSIAASPHHSLAVILSEKVVLLYDSARGLAIMSLPNYTVAVSFMPGGQSIMSGGWDEDGLRLWNIEDLLRRSQRDDKKDPLLLYHSDLYGTKLYESLDALVSTKLSGPQVSLSNYQACELCRSHSPPCFQTAINSLSISSDGHLAASGSLMNDTLLLWNLDTCQPLVTLGGNWLHFVRRNK